MGVKRKRGYRKPAAKKPSALSKNKEISKKPAPESPSAVGQNEEAFLNFINQNNRDHSGSGDSNDFEVDQSDADSSSSSSSSSSVSNDSFNVRDSSSDEAAIDNRAKTSVKGNTKLIPKTSKFSKKERTENLQSSRVLRSSSRKQKELETPCQDPPYNKKQLKAALAVIKRVMKMDEAQPFNVPMDPVALGLSGYYDVIDTPMDFGTICRNLQDDIKYMNSDDVFKDVQYIWENCRKYNKKSEYIVYLMKLVKKKFMKYWTAAGLYNEQSRKTNGNLNSPPPVDNAIRHNRCDPMGHAMGGASQLQQDMLTPNQPHLQLPPLSCSQPYQSQKPLPSTMWPQFSQFPSSSYNQPHDLQHPQPSANQGLFSQLQAHADCGSAGHSRFQPPVGSFLKKNKHAPRRSLGLKVSEPPSQSPPGQAQLGHKQPSVLQQPQQSVSQLKPSQLQAAADAGHSNFPPQTDHTRCSEHLPCYPVNSMVGGPGQPHSQQSPLSHEHSNGPQQPQTSQTQPRSSHQQANIDNENSPLSPSASVMRGIRCAMWYSAGAENNNPSPEHPNESCPAEQNPLSQDQSYRSQQMTKMKRGRGPTRCLFLNDLADGERIFVPVNRLGQPVGPEASKLSSFLGTVARNGVVAPLTYVQWRQMPLSYKEEMWQLVQTKFELDSMCKIWVMKSLSTKWRDWKAELKATHYYPHKTDEERLKDCDPRIVPEQWPFLVSYWNSDSAKKICVTNRANRAKHKGAHTSGTKSYARRCEEERNKRPDGKEPTRAELYILTHTRKDGQPVNESAAETISKLREQSEKKQRSPQRSDEENDTFCEVMGEEKGSHIGQIGLGPTPADCWGPKPSRADLMRMVSEAKMSANEEVSKMVEKMEAMEQKYDRMENQLALMTSSMQKFLEKLGGPSNILNSEQVLNTPNFPEHSPERHVRSSSSSHAMS